MLDEQSVVIAELRVGDCFGEQSTLSGSKCSASVRAKAALELLAIPRQSLQSVVSKFPDLKTRLDAVAMARRQENKFIMRWGEAAKNVKGAEGASGAALAEAAQQELRQRQRSSGGDEEKDEPRAPKLAHKKSVSTTKRLTNCNREWGTLRRVAANVHEGEAAMSSQWRNVLTPQSIKTTSIGEGAPSDVSAEGASAPAGAAPGASSTTAQPQHQEPLRASAIRWEGVDDNACSA